MNAYVVESPLEGTTGRHGTARVYVATEERAKEIAAQHPERTWRAIPVDEMPARARFNMFPEG